MQRSLNLPPIRAVSWVCCRFAAGMFQAGIASCVTACHPRQALSTIPRGPTTARCKLLRKPPQSLAALEKIASRGEVCAHSATGTPDFSTMNDLPSTTARTMVLVCIGHLMRHFLGGDQWGGVLYSRTVSSASLRNSKFQSRTSGLRIRLRAHRFPPTPNAPAAKAGVSQSTAGANAARIPRHILIAIRSRPPEFRNHEMAHVCLKSEGTACSRATLPVFFESMFSSARPPLRGGATGCSQGA